MVTRKFQPKRLQPTWCLDNQPHHRRLNTPDGSLMVGSVCIRCGEKREYRASEIETPTEFSLRSSERQIRIREMGV